MDKPLYIAKKSGFSALRFKWVLSFLILVALAVVLRFVLNFSLFWIPLAASAIPLLIQIVLIIRIKTYRLKIYSNRIVTKIGIIFSSEDQALFMGVYGLSVDQGFWGHLLDFGTVRFDSPGKFGGLIENGILRPNALNRFLQKHFVSPDTPHMVVGL